MERDTIFGDKFGYEKIYYSINILSAYYNLIEKIKFIFLNWRNP